MRHFALLLIPALAAAPLAGQGFEGTVNMKPSLDGQMPTRWMIKGQKIAVDAVAPVGLGPMAGTAMHLIIDEGAQSMTILAALTPEMSSMMGAMLPPGTKGLKMVTPLPKNSPAATGAAKNLGTSQTIAGTKCEDYEATGSDGKVERMCITHDLGEFAYPAMGGRGGRGMAGPAWVEALRQVSGFPLKVWTPAGKVDFEVESIQRGPVPARAFEIPEGYNSMPGMGGRGGL